MSLIRQRIDKRVFDSPIVSFAAILAWDTDKNVWRETINYTSVLSQIIYDAQLVVLLYCLRQTEAEPGAFLGDAIRKEQAQWMKNDTAGPIGEILSYRLLGLKIGRNTVGEAQIR